MSNNHRTTTGGGNTTNSGYYHTTPQPFVPPQFRPQQQTSLSAETTPTAPPPPPYNPDHSQHLSQQQNQQQPFVPTAYAVAEPYNPYAQQQQPPHQQPLPPHQQQQQPFVVPAAAYQQATTSYQAAASSVSSSPHHHPPARPSLSNPTAWFEHYDRDGSGTLNREEVVSALIDTCGVTADYRQRSLRETVYSIWTVFDHNGNGSIDKREFSAAGGLGESLQATMRSQFQSTSSCDDHRPSAPPAAAAAAASAPHSYSAPTAPVVATATTTAAVQASAPAMAVVVATAAAAGPAAEWSCPACTFSNPVTNQTCAMCETPRGGGGTSSDAQYYHQQQQPQQQAATTQQRRQTQTIRVGIAAGMRAGQKIKVPTPDGGSRTETIPDSSRWVYLPTGQAAFDIEIPVMQNKPVVIKGTHVTQQHQQQYQQSSSSQPPPPQWQRYEDIIAAASYQPPVLGLRDVPYRAEGVPSYLNPFQPSGRRRALIIGINYTGTRAALRGCVNDANNMKRLLVRSGYPDDSSHMVVLTDESVSGGGGFGGRNAAAGRQQQYTPTYENIRRGMRWLVQGVAAGDVLFFHFSGHGAQVPDRTGHETDGLNETILPLDYQRKQITDDELWGTMVYPLPAGTKLTALMDCCHSGTGLDLPFEYRMDTGRTKNRYGLGKPYHRRANGAGQWIEDVNPAHSQGDVVLFSGCEDHQTSADACDARQAGGAMTQSFLTAYEENPLATYPDFLRAVHAALKRRRFKQRPQLTSSQPFTASERVFSLTEGIESNRNAKIGRVKNRHVRPGRANGGGGGGPMDALLLGGVGVLGALAIGEMLF